MTVLNSTAFFGYGSENMGMGHMVRMEALAEAFLKKYPSIKITIVIPEFDQGLAHVRSILGNKAHVVSVDKRYAFINALPKELPDSDVVIFDCLQNPIERVCAAKQRASCVVLFDDSGPGILDADLSFNPLYRPKVDSEDLQKRNVEANDALGYIPLRPEFTNLNGKHDLLRPLGKNKKVLVLQGGADGWNGLTRIVKKMYEVRDDVIATAVAGAAYTHASEMKKLIKTMGRVIHFKQAVSNIQDLMLDCDAAISGCGLSVFELVCLGVPTITLTDENKELETAQRLEEEGCVLNLGMIKKLSDENFRKGLGKILDDKNFRKSVYSKGIKEIDGKGADHVVERIVNWFEVN